MQQPPQPSRRITRSVSSKMTVAQASKENDIEITLADQTEKGDESHAYPAISITDLPAGDRNNVLLLILLYFLQGVPFGLIAGSLPFLLKRYLSFSELAFFSLASYPYSLKLLWSPVVDAFFVPHFGRRKTWIVPTQCVLGALLFATSYVVESVLETHEANVPVMTTLFFLTILMAATQDIAVDGWALELLSKANRSFASTSQTVGLQIGFFSTYTVFLALNSPDFCKTYLFLETNLVDVGGFMRFWAALYIVVSVALVLFKHEPAPEEENLNTKETYKAMWDVLCLPSIRSLLLILLVHKIAFIANESITPLKLIDLGFSKEQLALTALLDFPSQIVLSVLAAKWSMGPRPLQPWLKAQYIRAFMALVGMGLIYFYPRNPSASTQSLYFIIIVIASMTTSFCSTVMFVGQGAFFARISDPLIGGTYLTLLNTFSNLGGTWPKWFLMRGVDVLTWKRCQTVNTTDFGAPCDLDNSVCSDTETCATYIDGYFSVAWLCLIVGGLLLHFVVRRNTDKLQTAPDSAWRTRED